MRFFAAFPFLALALIAYNVFAFSGSLNLDADMFVYDMMSKATFALTGGDVLIIVGLGLLFLEVIKAASIGTATILDHILSTAVFIAGLIEFLLVKQAGTAVFLILVIMCLIDVVAGYSVSIRSARRDVNFGGHGDPF
ncbi:MAG TPA: hypothetical protein ENJ55_02130 [Rhizobiales bacterium]|nr:hypothetical protein [Hyphomicrobiales bacterium]